MADAPMTKLMAKTAQDAAQRFNLSEKAVPLLKEAPAPAAFLKLLVEKGHLIDAVQVLGHSLPKREAVGWALVCSREAYGATPEPTAAAALLAVAKWMLDPSDDNRRATQKVGDAAKGTSAGCCASAAFFSGGSIGPANQAAIQADDKLTGKLASGAVLLAGVLGDVTKAMERYRRFVEIGMEVARGASPWKPAEPAPKPAQKR
jgi:hypothetical protein